MQPLESGGTTKDAKQLHQIRDEKYLRGEILRMGSSFSALDKYDKIRFKRIESVICKEFNINFASHPAEVLLIRQFCMLNIRMNHAQDFILLHPDSPTAMEKEKWLSWANKESRDTLATLRTLLKVGTRKRGVETFDDLRNKLRKEKGLGESTTTVKDDGHDRRFYDDIIRTVASDEVSL